MKEIVQFNVVIKKLLKLHQVFPYQLELRMSICEAAVKLMKNVNYLNAGTVEFLVSGDEFYFIEVNPRVQVEHTITEMITGIDIVQYTNSYCRRS